MQHIEQYTTPQPFLLTPVFSDSAKEDFEWTLLLYLTSLTLVARQ